MIAIHDDLIELNTQASPKHSGDKREAMLRGEAKLIGNSILDSVGWISSLWVLPAAAFSLIIYPGVGGRTKKYDILKNHPITAEDLQACAKSQKFVPDILFLRMGFTVGYVDLSEEKRN